MRGGIGRLGAVSPLFNRELLGKRYLSAPNLVDLDLGKQSSPMDSLSPLERAVLSAIALQVPASAHALGSEQAGLRVVTRENTGAGFYTTFDSNSGQRMEGVSSPVGDIGANIKGLEHGMGFLLWLKDGCAHRLEGYSYGESTTDLDFEQVVFAPPGPRI